MSRDYFYQEWPPRLEGDRGQVRVTPLVTHRPLYPSVFNHGLRLLTSVRQPIKRPWLARRAQASRAILNLWCRAVSARSQLKPLCRGLGVAVFFGSFSSAVRRNEHKNIGQLLSGHNNTGTEYLLNSRLPSTSFMGYRSAINIFLVVLPPKRNIPRPSSRKAESGDARIYAANLVQKYIKILIKTEFTRKTSSLVSNFCL